MILAKLGQTRRLVGVGGYQSCLVGLELKENSMADWHEGLREEQRDKEEALKKSREQAAEFYLAVSAEIDQVFKEALDLIQDLTSSYRKSDYTLTLPHSNKAAIDVGRYEWMIRNEYKYPWVYLQFGPGPMSNVDWSVGFVDSPRERHASVNPQDFSIDWLKSNLRPAAENMIR
jgi:hypothetical protein